MINEYLKEIGLWGTPIHDRINELLEYSTNLFGPMDTIFVSEYIDSEDNIQYESLWVLDKIHMIEFKSFRSSYEFDIFKFNNKIIDIRFDIESFDLKSSTDKSRMSITLRTSDQMSCTYKSSKNNCQYLLDIFKIYFINNMG